MDLMIRTARTGDAAVLTAHNIAMALETEGRALDLDKAAKGVDAVLADPGKGFYVVAEHDGRVIGQLMITFEWSDWRNGNFWWIQSVYVVPDHRGRGIFTRLFEEVGNMARAQGVVGIRLYVEAENETAMEAYRKLGMQESHYRMWEEA